LPGIKLPLFGLLALVALASPAVQGATGTISLHWETEIGEPAERQATVEKDVWQRVRDGFKIADNRNSLIAVHEKWYASRPQHVERIVERARRYLFHIVQEVERRGMPMEIALLPMIESAFDPKALSPAAASGIWQFIPSTGSLYGLKQDRWYDGRRDILASTNAALDYLGKLYLDFGDWQLALAAYNCGEGCVARAIARNVQRGLPTDYASLSLPNETRHYVPKLLAIKKFINDPQRYGIAIAPLPNQPYFAEVVLPASIDIPSAARLANMNPDEFAWLNPAHSRNIIRSDTRASVLVPVSKAAAFQESLEYGSWDTWKPYEARKGERIEEIARRFDTTAKRIEDHNQIALRRGKLLRDQTILVPHSRPARVARPVLEPGPAAINLHYVAGGETLYGISRRYGITVASLIEANPILNSEELKAGQTLRLPPLQGEQEAPPARVATVSQPLTGTAMAQYLVRPGDTLFSIAQRHRVSIDELRLLNPALGGDGVIKAGDTIRVSRS
jgi:membrane-bound lytic murein transglycosylase D